MVEWHHRLNGHAAAAAAAAKSLQSCPTLCDPIDSSPPGSTVPGILQARILEWVAISFSRGSSQPRHRTQVSLIVGGFFTSGARRGQVIFVIVISITSKVISLYYCCHYGLSVTVGPGANYAISLSLSFLIFKMGKNSICPIALL